MDGDELKTRREALGLCRSEFAERIGVTAHAVRHWEAGRRRVPGPVVVWVREHGVTAAALITRLDVLAADLERTGRGRAARLIRAAAGEVSL